MHQVIFILFAYSAWQRGRCERRKRFPDIRGACLCENIVLKYSVGYIKTHTLITTYVKLKFISLEEDKTMYMQIFTLFAPRSDVVLLPNIK